MTSLARFAGETLDRLTDLRGNCSFQQYMDSFPLSNTFIRTKDKQATEDYNGDSAMITHGKVAYFW